MKMTCNREVPMISAFAIHSQIEEGKMSRTEQERRLGWYCALFTTTALCFAGAEMAWSQDGSSDDQVGAGGDDSVTVYGTSNPLSVMDYPGQVSVITRDDLETLVPSAVSDALRDVPGLNFAGGPRRTGELPSIRGLSGQNVLVLLDGARQSFTSAHDGRFFVDPEVIGTAEVVRGPASALYGSGAVGGVLAFESVDAGDLLDDGESWGARARGGYQSVNEEALASLTAYTRQGAFDGLASFGVRQSGDIALGSGADLPSEDDILTALVKGSYAFSDALFLDASWQHFSNAAVEPNNGQGTMGLGDDILDLDVDKDVTTDTFRVGAVFAPADNDWIDFGLTVYNTTSEVSEFDASLPRTITREIDTLGLSLRNASRFALGPFDTTLTLGGDWYEDEQFGGDDHTDDGARGGVPNAQSSFMGVFAQLETVVETPAGQVLVIPGVRYDAFESSSQVAPDAVNADEAVSPRVAASFTPANAEWLRVFASYSEGFRAPSVNELFLDGVHFSIPHPVLFDPSSYSFVFAPNNFVPNTDLVPETTQTVELGVGFDIADLASSGDRLQLKLSRYETMADDLINLSVTVVPDATCFMPPFFQPCTWGTSQSSNVDRAELDGWEAEARYEAGRVFAHATYSSVEGRDLSDGSDLGSLTPDRLALNVGVTSAAWNTVFGARLQLADDFSRYVADGDGVLMLVEEREGYGVLDVYASWSPQFADNLRLDVGVDNLLDHDYDRVFEGVSEPGRNIKLTATYQIGG